MTCPVLTLPAAACPSGAAGTPCTCTAGYSGQLAWDPAGQVYSGTCTGQFFALGTFSVAVGMPLDQP
jgi:hypothetical protein